MGATRTTRPAQTATLLLLGAVSLWASLGYSQLGCYPNEGADLIFSHVERADGSPAPQREADRWQDAWDRGLGIQASLDIQPNEVLEFFRTANAECLP